MHLATATAPGGLLTLASADADTAIDLTGTDSGLLIEFGIAVGPAAPNNLLTQGAVTAGQTLTITIGTNTPLTVTFGTDDGAAPPEVSTLAELNAALGTLTGGTASVNLTDGNISITAGNTSDAIAVGGQGPFELLRLAGGYVRNARDSSGRCDTAAPGRMNRRSNDAPIDSGSSLS